MWYLHIFRRVQENSHVNMFLLLRLYIKMKSERKVISEICLINDIFIVITAIFTSNGIFFGIVTFILAIDEAIV